MSLVAKGATESEDDRQRRERAVRFARHGVLDDPSAFVDPREARVVRGERHDLSAGVGSATTAETITRKAAPTPEDEYKTRVSALPKKLQQLVASGLPLSTAELLALVVAHYNSKKAPAKLDPGTAASMLGMKRDDGARVLTDAIARGLLIAEMGMFGTNGGYRPAPQLL